MSTLDYHLEELRIALDKTSRGYVLPELQPGEQAILDIGCGIGQSLVAMHTPGRLCVGLDVDEEALRYGMQHHGTAVQLIYADAQRIPLPAGSFDLVFSRVALPYMRIHKVLREVRRVLKPGGRAWFTIHSRAMARKYWADARASGSLKNMVYALYRTANGHVFNATGRVLPFVNGRYESWQDIHALARHMQRLGFDTQVQQVGAHQVLQARKL